MTICGFAAELKADKKEEGGSENGDDTCPVQGTEAGK
jgi:hypothetical protein